MTKEQKKEAIEILKQNFMRYANFYVMNTESLTVSQTNALRKLCFEKTIHMKVAKNTLIKKALGHVDTTKYADMVEVFNGVTALMFSDNPKDPAVLLTAFRLEQKTDKPILKAAFIDGDIFIGDNQLSVLKQIKTKTELIAELVGLLQSPMNALLSGLQNTTSHKLTNLLKTLESRS